MEHLPTAVLLAGPLARRGARWRLLAVAAVLFFALASSAAVRADEVEEDEDSRWPEWTAEADLEFAAESQGDESSTELTFDEVSFAVEADRWSAEASVKYESEGDQGLLVEEAALRIGGTDRWPWFAQVGRTVVAFGDYESAFVEDPMTALAGETDQDALTLGFVSGELGASVAIYVGDHAGDRQVDFAAALQASPAEDWLAGLSWSSDLGEATELTDIRESYREEAVAPPNVRPERVAAVSAFVAWETERTTLRTEFVAGLSSLAANTLTEEAVQPAAWHLELTTRVGGGWSLTPRIEISDELPESPRWQAGLALGWELSEHANLIADYLRGGFDGDQPDRDLLSAQLSLAY